MKSEQHAKALSSAIRQLIEVSGASSCSVFDYDPETETISALVNHQAGDIEKEIDWQPPFDLKQYPLAKKALLDARVVQMRFDDPDIDPSEHELMTAEGIKSVLLLPTERGGNVIGMVELLDVERYRTFTEQEVDLLNTLAAHAAAELENSRLTLRYQQEHRLTEALIQVASALSSSLNLNEMLDCILEQITHIFFCQAVNIMLVEGEKAKVVRHLGYGHTPAGAEIIVDGVQLPLSLASFQYMLDNREPISIPDTSAYPGWSAEAGLEWVRSYVGVPLEVNNEVLGFINLDSDQPDFFSGSSLQELEAFASHAAIAIQNIQHYLEAQERARELEIVHQASLKLTASLDLGAVLNTILEKTLDAMPEMFDGHIFLYQNGKLEFGAALWSDGRQGEIWSEPRENGLTYTVARSGEPVVVQDMTDHPIYEDAPDHWEGSIVGLPLKIGDRVVGVMNIAHGKPYAFTREHLRLLRLLGDQAAIAIENARLHDLVRKQAITDMLTGLFNRRALNDRLDQEGLRSERYGHEFSLIMMDLNNFKDINDTYGHPVGDQVLHYVGQCLQDNVRTTDFLARYGGDEFALLMPETSLAEALDLARRLQRAVRNCGPGFEESNSIKLQVSMGIASFPENASSPIELLKAADQALYRSKEADEGQEQINVAYS